MDTLILKKTASVYGLGSNDDYVVLDADQVVGRVMLWPEGRSWFWSITARFYPPGVHSRGISATREQAMTDFNAEWVAASQPT